MASIGAVVAACVALPPAIASLAGSAPDELSVAWAAPIERLRFGVDPLSAFFIVPLMVLGAVCAIYGAFYLDDQRDRRWLCVPACSYNLLVAAMLLVLISCDAIGFVIAFDLGRFGIHYVAPPRHADGLLITGPVTANTREALRKTYEAVPEPRLVIAVGACAISGGPYIDHVEDHNGEEMAR
jgi:hypothetical protein